MTNRPHSSQKESIFLVRDVRFVSVALIHLRSFSFLLLFFAVFPNFSSIFSFLKLLRQSVLISQSFFWRKLSQRLFVKDVLSRYSPSRRAGWCSINTVIRGQLGEKPVRYFITPLLHLCSCCPMDRARWDGTWCLF